MVPLSFIQKSQLRTDFTTEALRHPYIRSIAIKEILDSRFSTAAFQFQSSQWEIEVPLNKLDMSESIPYMVLVTFCFESIR